MMDHRNVYFQGVWTRDHAALLQTREPPTATGCNLSFLLSKGPGMTRKHKEGRSREIGRLLPTERPRPDPRWRWPGGHLSFFLLQLAVRSI